jgi:hypothetical protein
MKKIIFILFFLATLVTAREVNAQGTYGCTAALDPTGSFNICIPMPPGTMNSCDTANGYDVGDECAMAPDQMTVDGCQSRTFTCVSTNQPPDTAPVPHQCNTTGVCTPCADPQHQDCNFGSYDSCFSVCQSGGTHWACGLNGCEPQKDGQYSSQVQCFSNCGAVEQHFTGGCNTTGGKGDDGVLTAVGCIPINLLDRLTSFFLVWLLGIGGGVAFLTFLVAGFQIITSSGDPSKLANAKSLLMSSISGIILLVFSIFLLRVIGVNVLGLF